MNMKYGNFQCMSHFKVPFDMSIQRDAIVRDSLDREFFEKYEKPVSYWITYSRGYKCFKKKPCSCFIRWNFRVIITDHSRRCFPYISETVHPLFIWKPHHYTNTSVAILHFQFIIKKKGQRKTKQWNEEPLARFVRYNSASDLKCKTGQLNMWVRR